MFARFGKGVENDVIIYNFTMLQCKNSINWAMKTHEGGLKVIKPLATIKQLTDGIKQLQK